MPEPAKGETQQEFVARCIPIVLKDGTAKDQKQAAAVCFSMWRQDKGAEATSGHEARSITLVGAASGVLRTVSFQGDDYLVVEVVALVGNAVIKALGSKGFELVPTEVLEASTEDWNDAPVTADHPMRGGKLVTARDPDVLERQSFGRVFNAQFRGGRLIVEAWLSRRRAVEVGEDAVRIIERLEAGDPVEVSVGASVLAMPVDRKQGAEMSYDWVWLDIKRDHLALLREGAIGACSLEMGCGAGRAARYQVAAEGLIALDDPKEETMSEIETVKPTVRERFLAFLDSLVAPVEDVVADSAPRAACDCQQTKSAPTGAQEDVMARTKAERAKALIENPKSPYQAAHQSWLETAPDDVLAALEEQASAPEPEKEKEEEPKVVQAAPVEPTETLPAAELATLRGMAAKYATEQAARKAALIGELKGAVAAAYTESELGAMSVDQLERTAKLVGSAAAIDHSLRRAAQADPTDVYRNPPDPWALALAAKQKPLVS